MNGMLAFNIEKLNDVTASLNRFSEEYKELIRSLDLEVERLSKLWGTNDSTAYLAFKEKYDEKKTKLVELESMIGELSNSLMLKKEEIENATRSTINDFQ